MLEINLYLSPSLADYSFVLIIFLLRCVTCSRGRGRRRNDEEQKAMEFISELTKLHTNQEQVHCVLPQLDSFQRIVGQLVLFPVAVASAWQH